MEREPLSIQPLHDHFGLVHEVVDPVAGIGYESGLVRATGDELTVQVFPDVQLTRVRTRLLEMTVRGSSLLIDDAHSTLQINARCDQEAVYVTLHENGAMVLGSVPARYTGEDAEPVPEPPVAIEPGPVAPAAGSHPSGSGVAEGGGDPEHPRLTLRGRVGAEPRFRTTKNDTLVCAFPLAVHDEAGKTTWHRVVAFKDRAQKLQGALQKGQEVEVIGYVHTSEGKDKDGNPKVIEEVWAAVVRRPKAGDAPSTPE
jgi:hypothetical protein